MAQLTAVLGTTHHPFYYALTTRPPEQSIPQAPEWKRKERTSPVTSVVMSTPRTARRRPTALISGCQSVYSAAAALTVCGGAAFFRRNFATKLWQVTAGFALRNVSAGDAHGLQSVGVCELALVDKWIITRLHRTLHTIEDAIAEYQFNIYCDAVYDVVWRDFCDWYVEAIKPTIKSSPAQQQVLRTVLNAIR